MVTGMMDPQPTGYTPNLISDRFGNEDSAYTFNGLTQYITFPVLFPGDQDSLSLVAWVNIPTGGPQNGGIYCETNGLDIRNKITITGDADTSELVFDQYRPAGDDVGITILDSSEYNTWHMLALVKNLDTVFFYKDDQLIGTELHTESYSGFL